METPAWGNGAAPFGTEARDRDVAASLKQLSSELGARGYLVQLVEQPGGRPRLKVWNADVPMLAEEVHAESGWYWYAFAEPIAPACEPAEAARKIAQVLHAAAAS